LNDRVESFRFSPRLTPLDSLENSESSTPTNYYSLENSESSTPSSYYSLDTISDKTLTHSSANDIINYQVDSVQLSSKLEKLNRLDITNVDTTDLFDGYSPMLPSSAIENIDNPRIKL
jgi:hypothetical protein